MMFRMMRPLTTLILILSVVQWIRAEKSCDEDTLDECLTKVQDYFQDDFHFTESNIDKFCQKWQEVSECLNVATEDCKGTYPFISDLIDPLNNQVNQLCSPGMIHKETYRKMLPCIQMHPKEFRRCFPEQIRSPEHFLKKFDDGNMQSFCMNIHSMICFADKSQKYCGEVGDTVAKSFESLFKDQYQEVCGGCTRLFDPFWILAPAVTVAVLLRNKMML